MGRSEGGLSLIELLIVLGAAGLLLAIGTSIVLPQLGRERARSAVYELYDLMQRARMEAVSRNRECQFLVCPDERRVVITDTMATATTSDDIVILDVRLSDRVTFEMPVVGPALTLRNLGGLPIWYGTFFNPDGTVRDGNGHVVVRGADRYVRFTVSAAGGTRLMTWNGSSWSTELF